MEIKIPSLRGGHIVIRAEKRLDEYKLPEGMQDFPISQRRGIDREHIKRVLGSEHSDVYLIAYEDITGIRLLDRKYR